MVEDWGQQAIWTPPIVENWMFRCRRREPHSGGGGKIDAIGVNFGAIGEIPVKTGIKGPR